MVYETHNTIGLAIHNRWKLQAIDSLDTSLSAEGMPTEERHKLINALPGDHEVIKDILLCQNHVKKEYMLAAYIYLHSFIMRLSGRERFFTDSHDDLFNANRMRCLFISGINDRHHHHHYHQQTSKYLTHDRDSACQVHLREKGD